MTRRGRNGLAVFGVLLIAGSIALAVTLDEVSSAPATEPLDPHPGSPLQIAALGDSYIAGEGAHRYFPGTDETGEERNLCHRAPTAYPYLIADELGASLSFVACSGALTGHVTGLDAAGRPFPPQYPSSGEGVHGAQPQVAVLESLPSPDVVLLSIGGNDAGFFEIGTTCAIPLLDCSRPAISAVWLRRLDEVVRPSLRRTYRAVRQAADGAPVLVFTYPNPFGSEYCDDLIGVNRAEMSFLRDVFLGRLNDTVKAAAAAEGLRVIDLTDALAGYRFCEQERLRDTAIHFVTLGRTTGTRLDLAALLRGSFHPDPLGHRLIRDVAISAVAGSAMPTAQR